MACAPSWVKSANKLTRLMLITNLYVARALGLTRAILSLSGVYVQPGGAVPCGKENLRAAKGREVLSPL